MNRILPALCAALLAAPAAAGELKSLKEKKAAQAAESTLKEEHLGKLNEACGSKVAAAVDWKSFKGKETDTHDLTSAAHYCGGALDGVRALCDDEDGKKAVTDGVKRVRCAFKAGAKKPELKFDKGVLSVAYEWESANLDDAVKAFLMEKL